MSTSPGAALAAIRGRLGGLDTARTLALLAVAGSLAAPLTVMFDFIDVVGLPTNFLAVVVVSILAATLLSRVLRPWIAVVVSAALLAAGLGWYLTQLVGSPDVAALVGDTVSLFAGRSLLRISNIREWVLGVSPAPVFLTWYFAVRRWYVPAVVVSGATLLFFVLTGDATATETLLGVVSGAAAVGIGDLDLRDEPPVAVEPLVVLVAVMVVVPSVVSVVPTAAAVTVPSLGLGGDDSLETSLMDVQGEFRIQGSITLSPETRFSVESTEERYWRVAAYDRYTGGGWVQTGGSSDYGGGEMLRPPGSARTVRQTFTAEAEIDTMPAAWKPITVDGVEDVGLPPNGGLQPGAPFEAGETYSVESAVPSATPRELQNAGTNYSERIASRYTQLPASTPDRVVERTDRLTAEAETPYETALVVEQWLENNRNYSLSVDRPQGNIADAFLFEMRRGYCTYYATTMTTMLRSQDIPARMVVGYTPGQRVGPDDWVVRGYNSHAWVEVYFPETGWIRFDPTPAGPRETAEDARLENARQSDATGVDTGESVDGEYTPTPTRTPEPLTPVGNTTAGATTAIPNPQTPPGGAITDIGLVNGTETATVGDLIPDPPSRQELALWGIAVAGMALAARRTGAARRAYRWVWLRYQPRSDPESDVERAFDRLTYHLEENSYRTRKPTDTVREFMDKLDADDRARRVAEIRERARHAGRVTPEEADEAVRLTDEIVR